MVLEDGSLRKTVRKGNTDPPRDTDLLLWVDTVVTDLRLRLLSSRNVYPSFVVHGEPNKDGEEQGLVTRTRP